MKKALILLVGLAASGIASAQVTNLDSGRNAYRMNQCGLLANDIVLTLSANVTGAVNCNDDENFVSLSFCHTSGLVASRSAVVTHNENGVEECTVSDDEDCVETVSGATFPSSTTADGTVRQIFPGNTCSQGNAVAVAESFNPPEDD